MSLSTTTLSDFHSDVESNTDEDSDQSTMMREKALEGGARYRSPPTTDTADVGENLGHGSHTCKNCGATVTPTYHRANCDNNGVLHHCRSCVNQTDMYRGAGAKPDFEARCPDTGGAYYGSE